jgi:hypothetical protein
MADRKPKPLVLVFRQGAGDWHYVCSRCHAGGWDRIWSAALDRGINTWQVVVLLVSRIRRR